MMYNATEGNRSKDFQFMMPSTANAHFYKNNTPPTYLVNWWLIVLSVFLVVPNLGLITLRLGFYCFLAVYLVCAFSLVRYVLIRLIFRRRIILEPQSGFRKIDPYLREAIAVWCLFESLKDARTKRGMIAAIVQYLQSHTTQSLPYYLYNKFTGSNMILDWTSKDGHDQVESMIEEAFGEHNIKESKDEIVILDIQNGNTPWHVAMESAFTNWKEFKTSTVAKKFTNLINIIVSAGMCSTAGLTFKLGNVSLFSPIVTKKQLGATDVFEAFYEAISGFMKGGWRVYQTGEVSTFFIEDDKISEFEEKYNEIRSWHGYALTGNLREYTPIDDNEYENRLSQAIELGTSLISHIKRSQTFERKYISDRMDKLRDCLTEFTQLRTRGGLRIAPFAISLFGQSGCGKSSLTSLTMNAGLIYNGLSAEKDRIATWADNDKFASAIRSHINGIIFDDFANTKEEFMDFSPAYRLIQVINNIKYLAPMADVFLKGKVSLNPYFCLVSTNVEHLNAGKYSNEPESVLRRMYHVLVKPKPEFCTDGILDSEKIRTAFGNTAIPDIWNLTVRRYEAQNKRFVIDAAFKVVTFEGKELRDVSVNEYLYWVQKASKIHFAEQSQYLSSQEEMPTICDKCKMVYCNCKDKCQDLMFIDPAEAASSPFKIDATIGASDKEVSSEPLNTQSGLLDFEVPSLSYFRHEKDDVSTLSETSSKYELFYMFRDSVEGYLENKAETIKDYTSKLSTKATLASESVCARWEKFDCLPESLICHPNVLRCCLLFWKDDIKQSLITGYIGIVLSTMILCIQCPCFSFIIVCCMFVALYIFTCATIQTYKRMISNRILELKDVVKTYIDSWQFKYAIIGLGAIAFILATMRSRYESLEIQTGLEPENIEQVNERNDAVNPWLNVYRSPLPMSEPSKTTASEDLAQAMRTNLIGIVSDKNKTTLGFYITSNFVIVPTHFIEEHEGWDISVRCYKTGENEVGSYFRDKISTSFTVDIPTTDFSLVFLTSGGSMKDFRKFLPLQSSVSSTPAKLVTRDIIDTSVRTMKTLFKGSTQVSHTKKTFNGGYYTLPEDTKCGMCMSPLISDAKGSMLIGFHLGGKGKLGGCGILTFDQVDMALQEMSQIDGVVLSASSGKLNPNMGDFPGTSFGTEILQNEEIHYKSATRFLTEGACLEVYGTTVGKATPHSNVSQTCISEAVEEVFGVPQKWGAPKMKGKGKYPYQATLAHAAIPSLSLGSVLTKSVKDYKSLSTNLKVKIPELFKTGPLSRVATVSGLPGVKYIDAINFSTSPGFPLSGSKVPLTVELDPEEYPGYSRPRTFIPEIWEEFDKTVETLRSGKRCYMIWKSCLKDEATKLSSDKVRVFQSAPLVLQLLIRMYFLPIVRIIQMNPILFECAVGVNAEGPEWEQLWDAAMSKGKDRVLAGDYSKYDVRMPAQVTIAAFDILIDMAQKSDGYKEEDLHLMRMLVHEVVYPVMANNGDLIQLFGTNPSGQNLTVIINSAVNSLLLRSAFFTIYPNKDFKENCAFLTYGDDVIGTVSENCGEFTHITYAQFLAKHDMKFTMPDKESTPVHYMKEEDVDFLKRKCEYNEDLSAKVGLLSEDSIYKRLHAHILSKDLTLQMHSAQNIESSLHDWFYYGREIFEDRKEKLKQVAQKCDIEHLCPALNVSYDKRVNHWRHKYLGEDLIEDEDENPCLE